MYDHTIDKLPEEHEGFHFFKTGITGTYNPNQPELETLPRLIEKNGHQDDYNIILKLDIDVYEWDVLENIDFDTLSHFSQIAMEMHWFWYVNEGLKRAGLENKILFCLDKLNATHQLVHIHGNNAVPMFSNPNNGQIFSAPAALIRDGMVLPNCIECTYLRKDKYKFKESKRFFPTSLDSACDPRRPDINLGFWK